MSNQKTHDAEPDRQTKYRQRLMAERNMLNMLGLQAQGKLLLQEEINETKWYRVTMSVVREDGEKLGKDQYILSGKEFVRFNKDLYEFNENKSGIWYSTYAFADCGDPPTGVPGIARLAFVGRTITNINVLTDYKPPHGYSTSEGTVMLYMSQERRPNPLIEATTKETS